MEFTSLAQFYTSNEWRKMREFLINTRIDAEGKNICAECGKPIVHGYECIGHHKEELTMQNVNDRSISLNPDNIDLVHLKCHNKIHNRFGGRIKTWQRKVYYVYGAPCSGKSTFVRENMQRGDLVCDIDRLWQAVSGQPAYVKPNELKQIVFNVRNSLLDGIKTRAGNWQTAWVIEGGALIGDRMRRIETLGAESIFIDTPKEVCLERLASDDSRQTVQAEWGGYIEQWFREYQPDAV